MGRDEVRERLQGERALECKAPVYLQLHCGLDAGQQFATARAWQLPRAMSQVAECKCAARTTCPHLPGSPSPLPSPSPFTHPASPQVASSSIGKRDAIDEARQGTKERGGWLAV